MLARLLCQGLGHRLYSNNFARSAVKAGGVCLLGGWLRGGSGLLAVAKAKAPPKPPKQRWRGVEPPPSDVSLGWRDYLRLLRPYSLYLTCAIVAAIVAAVLNVYIPLCLGKLVGAIVDRDGEALAKIGARLGAFYLVQGLVSAGYIALVSKVGEGVCGDLRRGLFASLLRQDVAFFDARRTGEIAARLSSDVGEFKSALKAVITQGLKASAQVVGSLWALWALSPEMTLWTGAIVPLVVVFGTGIGSGLRALSRRSAEATAEALSLADEALMGLRTVRAFAAEDWEVRRFDEAAHTAQSLAERLGWGIGAFQGASNVFLNYLILGVLWKGASLIQTGKLESGQLMSFLVTAQQIQKSMAQLSLLTGQVIKASSAGARVKEYLEWRPSLPIRGGERIQGLRGELELDGVSFAYPTRPEARVLDGLSLTIPAKSTVAICGPSGQGKSTVASLIERLYDVGEGSIRLDGVDLRSLDPAWLRGTAIGFIAQEPLLFSGTIAENIAYGREGASRAEIEAAAAAANADDFVRAFPGGYETRVGERGASLSGGERQRIAIARALLKDPAILILDEATSALDPHSEAKVKEAISRASQGRTVLIIAHRLSTIQNADAIVVLKAGRVAEQGSHSELMRKKGLYYRYVSSQLD